MAGAGRTPNPEPPGTTYVTLKGVDCPSSTSCFAVGSVYASTSGLTTLIERWDGTSWSLASSPDFGPFHSNTLDAVSCVTPSMCVAAGADQDDHGTLMERWDGASWSLDASEDPDLAAFVSLGGVSCSSPVSCIAVGSFLTQPLTRSKTLVEHYDGTSWSIVASPETADETGPAFTAVSCTRTTMCMAVGFQFSVSPLAARWDGTSWSMLASPSGFSNSQLLAVHCVTTTDCFAVGDHATDSGSRDTLVEHWDGSAWSIIPSPNAAQANFSSLSAISCTSAVSCFAVGSALVASTPRTSTLVERWNGVGWSIVPSPNVPDVILNRLSDVSCLQPSDCFAVGDSGEEGATATLIEHWDGTSWTIVQGPTTPGATSSSMLGVTCTEAVCFALGAGARGHAVIERWDGSAWTFATTPDSGETNVYGRGSISCTSSSDCFATGNSSGGPDKTKTLMLHWNGTEWSITPSPTPAGPSGGTLSAVSCVTPTRCLAVGFIVTRSTATRSLVESWNGT
ncbi:MAG: hypothetical protein ACXVKN_16490 [Acidimicrobiia bacterium]